MNLSLVFNVLNLCCIVFVCYQMWATRRVIEGPTPGQARMAKAIGEMYQRMLKHTAEDDCDDSPPKCHT